MLKKKLIFLTVLAVVFLAIDPAPAAAQHAVVSESLAAIPGGKLTVDVAGADIQINRSSGNVEVNVKGLAQEYQEWLEIVSVPGGVSVTFDPPRSDLNLRSLLFEISIPEEYNLDLETSGGDILVAASVRGNVSAESSGGDISIKEKITGAVNCSTSGGDIETADVEGEVDLTTSGGDIQVGRVSGRADLETSGGDIDVQESGGDLDAATSGGDIQVGKVAGNALLETAGGDISVVSVGGDLEANTAGGDIEVREARGEVSAETAGGDIQMEKVGGTFLASTVGGDVLVSLTGSSPGRMNTLGGELVLMLPDSAAVSIEAEVRFGGDEQENSITSEFGEIPLKTGSVIKSVSSNFDINGGGPLIEMSNLSGNIAVKKIP